MGFDFGSIIGPVVQAVVGALGGGGGEGTGVSTTPEAEQVSGGELGMSMGEQPGGGTSWYSDLVASPAVKAGGDLVGSASRSILPTILAGGATALINNLFGAKPKALPYKDIRTPDQVANYAQLSQDYRQGQSQMPLWNAIQEDEIRRNTLAEAARAGVADSGQAMKMVGRNLTDYRMNVAQQHEQNQIQRAGMLTGAAGPAKASQGIMSGYYPAQMGQVPVGVSVPKALVNDNLGQDANNGQPVSTNPYGGGRGQRQPSYRNPYS